MAQFNVSLDKVNAIAIDIESIKNELEMIESEIFSVKNNISFRMESAARIKANISKLAKHIGSEAKSTGILADELENIVLLYEKYESSIIDNLCGAAETQTVETSQNLEQEGIGNDLGEMSFQEAVDVLNNISMSTSIDGVVLALVTYLLKLYDSAADIGIFEAGGKLSTLGGLFTGVVADILFALDNGSTQNALAADIIVDISLALTGVAMNGLGQAIGTMVGGPVGTIVGDFVGGVVGNGISIAMNVDWNGDAEGGVGKDALSDWIDNQLDKLVEDHEFEAVI